MSLINSKVLVVSHFGPGGGAGIYIQNLVTSLEKIFNYVSLAGVVLSEKNERYVCRNFNCIFNSSFPLVIYNGPSLKSKLYYLFKLLIRFRSVFTFDENLKYYDIVFFTSSIQIIDALRAARSNPNAKIYVVFQENVKANFLNVLLLRYVQKYINLILISESLYNIYRENGIKSKLLINPFEKPNLLMFSNEDKYDILYVGGSQRIKGFDFLIEALSKYKGQIPLRVCLAGSFDVESLATIKSFINCNVNIEVVGLVESVYQYLCQSKILVLPIQKLHFCRPAIEAGLVGKTFVFPNFKEHDDFTFFGNCIKYKPNSVESFLSCVLEILDDKVHLIECQNNNMTFAKKFTSSHSFIEKLHDITVAK